jgi:signal transduction histidine kinase
MARERKSKRELTPLPQGKLNSWLEERLIASSWNEALSAISTGLAHDTNNCLTGILSMSDACLSQLDSQHPLRENLIVAKESAQKAAQIIQQLMRVHHEKMGKRAYEDLNHVTTETVELLKRVLRRQIELDMQLQTAPLPVYVDAVELRRILILLTLNAAQRIQAKGKISFRTSLHQETVLRHRFEGTLPRPPGVCLSIVDDVRTILAKGPALFDPVTYAQPGANESASGFLAAKQFVEKHQGAICVETAEGPGTTVELWLPQADFTEGENQ